MKIATIIILLVLSACYQYVPPQQQIPVRAVSVPVQQVQPIVNSNDGVIELKIKLTIDKSGKIQVKE